MYTEISIENPNPTWGENGEATLDDLTQGFEDSWGEGDDDSPGIAGWSNYQVDGLHEFASEYTAAWPAATITIREEWQRRGGPSIEKTVYRRGEQVKGEGQHSEMVPDNLAELVAHAREGVAYNDPKGAVK